MLNKNTIWYLFQSLYDSKRKFMLDQIRKIKEVLRKVKIFENPYQISFNDPNEYVFRLYLIIRKNNRQVRYGFQRFLLPSVLPSGTLS